MNKRFYRIHKSEKSHKLLCNLKLKKSHKLLCNLKSQAALEFLTTYAWALLAILITVGTLYYFGIFDFSKYLPQRCLFTSQLECIDFVLKEDQITFRLVNNLGEAIDVESFGITSDTTPALSCTTLPAPVSGWAAGGEKDIVFSGCSGGGYIKSERVEAKISLTYFAPGTPTQPRHTVNGKIQSIVQ